MTLQGESGKDPAAQAADFVARLQGEDATEADWLALEAWLAADAAHLAAYDRAERLWAEMSDRAAEIAPGLAADAPAAAVIDFTARRAGKLRRLGPAVGLAAAAALAVTIGLSLTPRTQVFETAPGETRQIALSDGTVIHLNGASTIRVRLGRRERSVEMDLAEASFDVAKDPGRPFVIDAGDSEVRVVGTEFNVSRSAQATTVTVRRGIVEVRPEDGSVAPVRLTPGRELTTAGGRYQVRQTNADAAFAWRGGRLIYTDEPLSEVAADLSRRLPKPVRVEGAAASLRFTGVLVLDDPDAVIGRLEGFLPIKAHRSADAITLSSR